MMHQQSPPNCPTMELLRDMFTDWITAHEALVRRLFETKFAGLASVGLIARWKMAIDTSRKDKDKDLSLSSYVSSTVFIPIPMA